MPCTPGLIRWPLSPGFNHLIPHRWATFIANRTSQIQSLTPPSFWRYVSTSENPVDCASCGIYPTELLKHPMWWNGPAFLAQDHNTWPLCSATAVRPRSTTHSPRDNPDQHHFRPPLLSIFVITKDHSHHRILQTGFCEHQTRQNRTINHWNKSPIGGHYTRRTKPSIRWRTYAAPRSSSQRR